MKSSLVKSSQVKSRGGRGVKSSQVKFSQVKSSQGGDAASASMAVESIPDIRRRVYLVCLTPRTVSAALLGPRCIIWRFRGFERKCRLLSDGHEDDDGPLSHASTGALVALRASASAWTSSSHCGPFSSATYGLGCILGPQTAIARRARHISSQPLGKTSIYILYISLMVFFGVGTLA